MINPIEEALLDFLYDYIRDFDRPPSQQEIARALKKSRSQVQRLLRQLSVKGFIIQDPDVARGLRFTNTALGRYPPLEKTPFFSASNSTVVAVPLIGYIFAGEPIELDSEFPLYDETDVVELSSAMFKVKSDNLVALRVIGESMIDAMVAEGDIVIMRPQDHAQNGDMVAVWLPAKKTSTLKHIFRDGTRLRLQPANPTMKPIIVQPDDIQIQGKIMMVIRQYAEPDNWRLDVAAPDQVYVDQAFELAVAIRPSQSTILDVPDLKKVSSADLQFNWADSEFGPKLQIQVTAPDCEVHDSKRQIVQLKPDKYPLIYFLLTPKKIGSISIVVTVYREENWLGNAPLRTFSLERIVGNVNIEVTSQKLSKDAKIFLRRNLEASFNKEEMQTLCFDLEIPFENLHGSTRQALAMSLIDFCIRHGLIGELVGLCNERRPSIDWRFA